MPHDIYDDTVIAGVLSEVRTIAMVGASANTSRPSYFVIKYLLAKGYNVVPVNPGLAGQEIVGQPVVATLADLKAPVDMIDIFRNSDAALAVVREALPLAEKLRLKVIWMQLGVRNEEAARLAEVNGLKVVMNRCPKIEYGRLSSEIAWMGVNTRTLSSKRAQLSGRGIQRMSLNRATLAGGATDASTRAQRDET
jgi:predicted CoA-binding protein